MPVHVGANHVVGTSSPDSSSGGVPQPDIEMDITSVHGGNLGRDQSQHQSDKAQQKDVGLAGIGDEAAPPGFTAQTGDTVESQKRMSRKDRMLMRWFPGAKIPESLVCVLLGVIMYCAIPRPAELTEKAWALTAIFVSTILGLIIEPLPVPGVALAGVVVALWSQTLTYPQAFSAFENEVIWLILGAFFFSVGVEKTGLGARIADTCIWGLGRSSLGLAYALSFADLVLAMGMPSTTARAAGVFVPLITSLSKSFGSYPNHPSSRKLGQFLLMSQAQSSIATCSLFYLGAAQTPALFNLAVAQGIVFDNPFNSYLKGSVVPSLVLIGLLPFIVYLLVPPEIKKTPWAQKEARERLRQRGRPSWREVTMGLTLLTAVALWGSSNYFPFRLSNASVALAGVVVLLAAGVVTWDDLAEHKPVWSLVVWLSILFSMATALSELGVIKWLSDSMSRPVLATGISTTGLFWLLNLMYFVLHYAMASQIAHVTALFPAFLRIMMDAGIDGHLATLSLAYITNLFAALTHYASVQTAAYYGGGFYSVSKNWMVGGVVGFTSFGLYLAIGMGWWRAVGIWK